MTLLLASASPQRRAILEQVGIPFRVVSVDVDETAAGDPEYVAVENSHRKAEAGLQHSKSGELVVGVDTLVAVDSLILGKPADRSDAERMLRLLAGKTHTVFGGLTAFFQREATSIVAATRVTFRSVDEQVLDRYLAGDEWQGRAGGYAIQGLGAAFVASIHGDYLNVVGFPMTAFLEEFGEWVNLQQAQTV